MKQGHWNYLQREAKGMLIVSKGACAPRLCRYCFLYWVLLRSIEHALEQRAAGRGSRLPLYLVLYHTAMMSFWLAVTE